MPYTYAHYTKDTNQIFYIGVAKSNQRLNSKKNRNKYWTNIIKTLNTMKTPKEIVELMPLAVSVYKKQIMDVIEQTQKEAYNHAIDEAAQKREDGNHDWCIVDDKYFVSIESIEKLRK
jgi:hypothetical protein